MVDRRMGCWLWNPEPRAGETVSWSNDCGADGRAEARGVREWRARSAGTSRFAGTMREGREDGRGTWSGPNGEGYLGNIGTDFFMVGAFSLGLVVSRYEGEFREGVFHGLGTLVEVGDDISAVYRDGVTRHGRGARPSPLQARHLTVAAYISET